MKKIFFPFLMMLLYIHSIQAMSYSEARNHARFLTDKMAYELNFNDEQYDYAYEINLDYLISLQTADDAYGTCLTVRNTDLRYILYDWQYKLFVTADYFLHPIYWRAGIWHYPIYTRYTPGHYYYNAPRVFTEYRGRARSPRHPHVSYYQNRRPAWTIGFRGKMRTPVEQRRSQSSITHPHPSSPAPIRYSTQSTKHSNKGKQYPISNNQRPNRNTPAHKDQHSLDHRHTSTSAPHTSKIKDSQKTRPHQQNHQPTTERRRSSTRTTVQQTASQRTARPIRNTPQNNRRPQR